MSPRSPYLTLCASAELKAAIHAYCDANGLDMSAWVRQTLADAIGQPLLSQVPSRGRPRKETQPAAAKRARKRVAK